jgi:antitoxin component of RelBE/YafQ-DinJ toxin-antitoxin module
MAEAISVRLDDKAEQALRALEATGLSRSEAIRTSLVQAARALQRRNELAAEVAELEADDDDRAEMLAIAQMMESLRAPG